MFKVTLAESYFPAQGGGAPPPLTVGAMLRAAAAQAPDRFALKALGYDGAIGATWTYAELVADAECLARTLAGRHAEGARIAVYANNIPEWVLLELASGLAGLTLVTINPSFQKRELKYVLEQSHCEAIYYVARFRGNPMQEIADAVCDETPAIRHRILLTDHDALFGGEASAQRKWSIFQRRRERERVGPLRAPSPSDAAQIQYTSGTTGFPKGALLHHNGLVRNGIETMTRAGLNAGNSFVHHMPLFHTSGCGILVLGGLGVGATILLAPMFDAVMVAEVIEREKTHFIPCVPTMLVALIDEVQKSERDVSSVKRIMSGGAMVAPELCKKARAVFGAPIQIVYGQTEASPIITQAWYDDTLEDLTETIGQPLPHIDVSIRDPRTTTVTPLGEQGEICCRGYSVMTGYNDNPEATSAAIDTEAWLHTGDLGRMDRRGYVTITGRVKDMIIRGGENLFPAEIENIMLEHEAVAEVAVVGVPDDVWGEQVACFMRSGGDNRPDDAALRAFVRERLSPQKTPHFWIWVDEWPLTGSGKIQKFKLREAFESGEFRAA